jgi:16S rRNA (uracil1498-N3)-methyltransferase
LNDSVEFSSEHAMSERFYISSPVSGDRAELTGDEARHLTTVMRAKLGDEVTLFDGRGAEFIAHVTEIRKHAVELTIAERREISRELPFNFTLAVALPKGDRQKWLVEKATELGVTRLVPLITERGVAQPTEAAIDRLRRSVIEASKQCGRNRLMEVAAPITAHECFQTAAVDAVRALADPAGPSLGSISFTPQGSIIAAIGPEGGFAANEIAAASAAGWQLMSLGKRILRVETAALAIASYFAIGRPQN